jgi:hypothetical protein
VPRRPREETATAERPRPSAAAQANVDEAEGKKPCHFCQKEVDAKDTFCFGCKTVICDECDVSMGGFGHGHSPEDHKIPPEETSW